MQSMINKIKYLFGGNSNRDLKSKFIEIHLKNLFFGKESISGPGSDLVQTEVVRAELPALLQRHGIKSMIDAPCGDFFWMRLLSLDANYTGLDIVKELTDTNQAEFGSSSRRFICLDIVSDQLPEADLIFCRDCLVHLTYAQALKAIANFKRSGAKYLLTTTFPGRKNKDLGQIIWRPLDLQVSPFSFPAPLDLINEKCSENNGKYNDKSLGLWKLSDIQL